MGREPRYRTRGQLSCEKLINATETYASSTSAIQDTARGLFSSPEDCVSVVKHHTFRSSTLGRRPICLPNAMYDSQQY